jgi:hypothetical protein
MSKQKSKSFLFMDGPRTGGIIPASRQQHLCDNITMDLSSEVSDSSFSQIKTERHGAVIV